MAVLKIASPSAAAGLLAEVQGGEEARAASKTARASSSHHGGAGVLPSRHHQKEEGEEDETVMVAEPLGGGEEEAGAWQAQRTSSLLRGAARPAPPQYPQLDGVFPEKEEEEEEEEEKGLAAVALDPVASEYAESAVLAWGLLKAVVHVALEAAWEAVPMERLEAGGR